MSELVGEPFQVLQIVNNLLMIEDFHGFVFSITARAIDNRSLAAITVWLFPPVARAADVDRPFTPTGWAAAVYILGGRPASEFLF